MRMQHTMTIPPAMLVTTMTMGFVLCVLHAAVKIVFSFVQFKIQCEIALNLRKCIMREVFMYSQASEQCTRANTATLLYIMVAVSA